MSIIRLHQMEFNAFHGCYTDELSMRQKFVINIDLHTDFSVAAKDDDLTGTIDYEAVYRVCDNILTGNSVSLIEHLAYKINQTLKSKFPSIEKLKIEIQKRDVQLGGKLAYAGIVWEG